MSTRAADMRIPSMARSLRGLLLSFIAAALMITMLPAASASAAAPVNTAASTQPTKLEVEQALQRLGLPVGQVDGSYTSYARRAFCAWRHAMGRKTSRDLPTKSEARAIVATAFLPAPREFMVTGLNVNQRCQTMFWVKKGSNGRYYRAVYGVSTGTQSHPTRRGIFRIYAKVNSWQESNLYPGSWMYRPMYFSGGMALHGSRNDSWVISTPASHGCVRMYHADVNTLWSSGVGYGTKVKVYDTFRW